MKLETIVNEIKEEYEKCLDDALVFFEAADTLRKEGKEEEAKKATVMCEELWNIATGYRKALVHFMKLPYKQVTKTVLYGTEDDEKEGC